MMNEWLHYLDAICLLAGICSGAVILVGTTISLANALRRGRQRKRNRSRYVLPPLGAEERMVTTETQAGQPFVKSPASEHYRWLQQEYAKKAFEQAEREAPRNYAHLANLAGVVADLKEGRGGQVPERVQREQQETTLFVQVERRRTHEGAIEVTNHPLFRRQG